MSLEPINTDQLRELRAGATLGPWSRGPGGFIDTPRRQVARAERDEDATAIVEVMNAAPALLDELDALRARLAELKAANLEKQAKLENMALEFGEAEGRLRRLQDDMPARDARMRREGAAEWLERFAADNQERYGTYFVETTTDSLLAEAERLRKGGE